MKSIFRYSISTLLLIAVAVGNSFSQTGKAKHILVIGVDGIIHSAIGYATTPGIDKLLGNGSYSMNGYGGLPAYSTTGWATMLTGVSADKHQANVNQSFSGNRFDTYPSVISRIKSGLPDLKVASIVRNAQLNEQLNYAADFKFHYTSDSEVYEKTNELLGQADIGVVFVQFSSPENVGEAVGFQLREAQYVLAIQQVDNFVDGLLSTIQARESYPNEDWLVVFASSRGGTESGAYLNRTKEEINVPIIFSGNEVDNKELTSTSLEPRENGDNMLTIDKSATGERTYVRVPINGTPLQGMDRYTIEMWVKAGSNTSDPAIMGDKNWASGANPGFIICRNGSTWKINFANDKGARYDIGPTIPIEDGEWHHLAVSFDKTNECIVYQDGLEVARASLTYGATDDMTSPYNYINLAQEGTGTYSGGGPNWAGSFNEVRIWTDVLSPETITNYMYLSHIENSNHPNLASLNLYLKMDEVRGNVVKDYSGKGHDGELIGPASERRPYHPVRLTDVSVNILSHLGLRVDGSWGLDGATLKSNVPFRLFKVN